VTGIRFGDVVVERKVPCTMRDGVTLYADVYRPRQAGSYPVLLLRQPYGRSIASTVSHAHPVWYVHHGYIVVVQDVRGRGDSEGEFVPFVNEANDGYDSVQWAAQLPDSNGKVGMYGFSYQGSVQWAAASKQPPNLVAIAPSMCAADIYHGWIYASGTLSPGVIPWAYQLARDTARRAGDAEAENICTRVMRHPDSALWNLPYTEQHAVLKTYFPAYYDWVSHAEYDEYWRQVNWLEACREHPVPAFHIGGWYDFLLTGTVQSFKALQNRQARTPELFHKLLIGPWVHIPWGRKAGGDDFGPLADGNVHIQQLRWFDYWLKDRKDNGLFEEPAVQYFEPVTKTWRYADDFPSGNGDLSGGGGSAENGGQHAKRWYLSGSGKPANGALGGGKLTTEAREIGEAAPDVFVYDARLPMPCDSYLPHDRSGIQDRYEILVYTSPPLQEDLHVFGSPAVHVQTGVLNGPTDLVAILTVLTPDGKAKFLSVGRTEIGTGTEEEAAQWRTAEIVMRPLAVDLTAGSAIRLELTGSAFPLLARHPNGVALRDINRAGAGDLRIATVAVRSTAGEASWIQLPLAGK